MVIWRKVQEIRAMPIYRWEAGQFGNRHNPLIEFLSVGVPVRIIFAALIFYGLWVEIVVLRAFTLGIMPLIEGAFSRPLMATWIMLLILSFVMRWFIWVIHLWNITLIPPTIAPMLTSEVANGSWDLLRLMPYPMEDILLAKTLGGMTRRGGIRTLLWLTLGSILTTISAAVILVPLLSVGEFLWIAPLIVIGGLRPLVDLFCVALVTLTIAIYSRTMPQALFLSSLFVVGSRVLVNPWTGAWMADQFNRWILRIEPGRVATPWLYQVGPTLILGCIAIVGWQIFQRSKHKLVF